jgi:hypothetical protein
MDFSRGLAMAEKFFTLESANLVLDFHLDGTNTQVHQQQGRKTAEACQKKFVIGLRAF